jgi:hypothetical protein
MAETEDQITKKLELADTWLTKLEVILRKHWGKLILLLFVYFIYWALTQPSDEIYPPVNTFQEPKPVAIVPDTTSYYETEEDTLDH